VSTIPTTPVTSLKPFSDYSLQKAIDRAVANLPEGHTVAAVAHVDNIEGASLSMIVRVGDEWKLSATLVKQWDQPFRFGAEAVWSR
jgi:hypothetical protein